MPTVTECLVACGETVCVLFCWFETCLERFKFRPVLYYGRTVCVSRADLEVVVLQVYFGTLDREKTVLA